MKIWKKNLVAAAVLVTVCAGIYVNWLYTQDATAMNLTDTLDVHSTLPSATISKSPSMFAVKVTSTILGKDCFIILLTTSPISVMYRFLFSFAT